MDFFHIEAKEGRGDHPLLPPPPFRYMPANFLRNLKVIAGYFCENEYLEDYNKLFNLTFFDTTNFSE